jgi:hypothetical protein
MSTVPKSGLEDSTMLTHKTLASVVLVTNCALLTLRRQQKKRIKKNQIAYTACINNNVDVRAQSRARYGAGSIL